MAASGYQIRNLGVSGGEDQKQVVVSPADGTIDVERVESDTEVDFRIKTTYDGYETINVGSPSYGGYYKAVHIKFNETNKRYRLVCILNGGSYTPVAEDFSIYYIKFGWGTGGVNSNHWYIQEYSRQGNGAYVSLEQIALNEYNVLIHTPTGYAYANIGILKEDKEPNVTIEHFNANTTRYTPSGTIITTETPNWKNGAPAVLQNIPDIVNPVPGMLGHYYNLDRNIFSYDGYNWHLIYALAQGVASMLATTYAPSTATDGTIYYDLTEGNLKIWINGGWKDVVSLVNRARVVIPKQSEAEAIPGAIRSSSANNITSTFEIFTGSSWNGLTARSSAIEGTLSLNGGYVSWLRYLQTTGDIYFYFDNEYQKIIRDKDIRPQVVTFTNYSGETITAEDKPQIIVTASFGSTSILDFSNIEKKEGKVIEISNLNGNTITMKDGATTLHLTNSNESVIKAICLSSVWHYYKVGSITEFT